MRRFAVLMSAAAVVLATVTMFAQAKPSFAGKWTLVPDPNAAAAAGGGGRGRGFGMGNEFSVTQDDKTIVVTTMGQNGEQKTTYNLDGSESKNPLTFGGNTIERSSKIKLDAGKLVITTTSNFNGTPTETTQTWSLDATGNLVIEQSGRQGGAPTKTTYKKS